METVATRVLLAFAAIAIAIATRALLDPWLGSNLPFITLYAGAAVAAWYGGFVIALIADLAGLAAALYFFVEPRGTFAPAGGWEPLGVAAQILVASGIIGIIRYGRLQQARAESALAAAEAANASLQTRTAELEVAKSRLEAADLGKNHAIARIAHELRNPLHPIVQSANALRRIGEGNRDLEGVASIIERQARQADRLVEDLLDLTRAEHGTMALLLQEVALDALLFEAEEATRWRFTEKRIEVERRYAHGLIVRADRARLVQALSNVLSNAARYTPAGGRVWIEATTTAGEACVRVRDSGIGIERDWLARVGEPFLRSPAAMRKSPDGLGIGLALCRGIMALHGGALKVESGGPGQGTTVTLTLPLLHDLRSEDQTQVPASRRADAVRIHSERLREPPGDDPGPSAHRTVLEPSAES